MGSNEYLYNDILRVFPNPSRNKLSLSFTLKDQSQVNLVLINSLGQIVRTLINETIEPGFLQVSINAENLPTGIYSYRLQTGNRIGAGNIIIMR
jgi:hypothetical protein